MPFVIIDSHPQLYCLFCLFHCYMFIHYILLCILSIRIVSRKVVNKTILYLLFPNLPVQTSEARFPPPELTARVDG